MPRAPDFVLEQCAVDHGMADVRVQHRHQIQRLNHIGAVLAAQRNERLEAQLTLQPPHLIHDRRIGFRRMAADLQEREHQRAELVSQRQPGETHLRLLSRPPHGERRREPPPSRRVSSRTRADEATMSSRSSSISRDASPSSSDATISTGWVSRSR